jgi:hypothetical protein
MPVILAIEEAEIRRISVGSQPGQTVCEALSSSPSTTKNKNKNKNPDKR